MFVVKTALNRLSLFLVIASASLSCIWTDASAQSRPALVRDTDNAALAPFKSHTHISATYGVSLNAVPAGKRLVIQNVSYSGTTIGTTIVSADLYNSADGDIRLELGVPIPIAAGNGASYYNYTTPATAYFEAGEVPVVAFGTLNGTAVYFDVVVTGYYVTP